MIRPGLLAVLAPIVVGVIFKYLGIWQGKSLLGAKVLCAFLMFSTSTGILMALFLNNAGGAWDNAKKYIETGAVGGKFCLFIGKAKEVKCIKPQLLVILLAILVRILPDHLYIY